MRGPLGRTYGKNGLDQLPVVRQSWGDTWPRIALWVALSIGCALSWVSAGWLRVVP